MAEEVFKVGKESKSDLPTYPCAVFEVPRSKATRYVEDSSSPTGERAVHGIVENRKIYFPLQTWVQNSIAPESHRDLQKILHHMQSRKRYRFKGFLNMNKPQEKRLAAFISRDLQVIEFDQKIKEEESEAFRDYETELAKERKAEEKKRAKEKTPEDEGKRAEAKAHEAAKTRKGDLADEQKKEAEAEKKARRKESDKQAKEAKKAAKEEAKE
jgi:hypothetical protein